MTSTPADTTRSTPTRGLRWTHVLGIVLVTIALTAAGTYWVARTYVFPKDFKPVTLGVAEAQTLDAKLRTLGFTPEGSPTTRKTETSSQVDDDGRLRPERYSEEGATREVVFSERELNALLAKNTDLARKLAIDLSDDLISAKLLVPMEEDVPVLGGRTLRVNAGLEVAYKGDKPVVILKGVSLMGVPIPNAWLGGLKNVDLVQEFGAERGFWKTFADGVETIRVEEGRLKIQLKE